MWADLIYRWVFFSLHDILKFWQFYMKKCISALLEKPMIWQHWACIPATGCNWVAGAPFLLFGLFQSLHSCLFIYFYVPMDIWVNDPWTRCVGLRVDKPEEKGQFLGDICGALIQFQLVCLVLCSLHALSCLMLAFFPSSLLLELYPVEFKSCYVTRNHL